MFSFDLMEINLQTFFFPVFLSIRLFQSYIHYYRVYKLTQFKIFFLKKDSFSSFNIEFLDTLDELSFFSLSFHCYFLLLVYLLLLYFFIYII